MPTYYSDIPADTDLLGRFSFAKEIAHSLVNRFKTGEDSIVIGINGKWGCGKSTLLKFIREEIKKETLPEKRILFEFNPWLFSGQKELQVVFLNQLLDKMRDLKNRAQKKVRKAKRLIEIISPMLKILSKIRPVAKYMAPGITDMIADFEKFISAFDKDKPLDKVKARVDLQIEKSEVMFFIFIDDIERLTPQETTEVFQLIKLNANFKNTVYIIAYDREIVQESLMLQYKEVGRRYLDKIVQVDYKVPEIFNEVLEDIFFERLQFFLEENAINYESRHFFKIWQHNDFKGFFNTVRDVYRYMNALQLRLPAIHSEIAVSDFLILEAIRLFDNYSYEEIYRAYKVSLIKRHSIQRVLGENNEFQAKSNPFSRALIKELFAVNEGENKGISDPRYFERYFSLSLSSADVIGDAFNEFIYKPEQRVRLLQNVFSSPKASYFIRRVLNSPIETTDEGLKKMIFDIISFGNDHHDAIPMEKYGDHLFDLVDSLAMKCINKKSSYSIFFDELLNAKYSDSMFVSFILGKYYEKINSLLQGIHIHNPDEQGELVSGDEEDIGQEYYIRIEDSFQKAVEQMVMKRLIDDPGMNGQNKFFEKFFMLKYAEFFPNGYYTYLKKLITSKQKEKLADIVSYALESNRASKKILSINSDYLLLIIPTKKMFEEITTIILQQKNGHENDVLAFVDTNMGAFQKQY